MEMEVLMLSKRTNFCRYAAKILSSYYDKQSIQIITGDEGTRIDDGLHLLRPRYVISFLSPWIIPESLLKSAQKAAINFHPGSPRYPGSKCYNLLSMKRPNGTV